MRASTVLLAVLLVSIPTCIRAAEQQPAAAAPDSRVTVPPMPDSGVPVQPAPDSRFPVQVSPEDAARQKTEMRNNLVALRITLARLADKDFAGVETALRGLAHTGPTARRPGVSTAVFRGLERQFEASVDKTIEAARSGQSDVVLRALSDTMAYCQSCHMAFRQAAGSNAATAPAPPAPATAP